MGGDFLAFVKERVWLSCDGLKNAGEGKEGEGQK